jgi:diguanylate cyclase (GGDEF)-like protein
MPPTALHALAQLSERRFTSFSDAADAVLDVLEAHLAARAILIGRCDWTDGMFRILDARGATEGVEPGAELALAVQVEGSGLLAPEGLQALGVRSYLAIPFETNDDTDGVTLCALGDADDSFSTDDFDLLKVAGRLLAYEWESVHWRADLRRMGELLRNSEGTDPVTGLPDAASFASLLEREWQVTQQGAEQTYVVVCRALDLDTVTERCGHAVARKLLKDMADVLEAAIRNADQIGRTGADEISVLLVGCKGRAGADAFFARFLTSFARVTSGSQATLTVAHGARALGSAEACGEAFEEARAEARAGGISQLA